MKRKGTTQSAFLNPRALVSLLCSIAVAALVLRGTMLAFSHSEMPTSVSQRALTFVERVAYQRAIEDIYWRHRIWPRPDPKPSLDAVMSQAQLEKKVEDYLGKSQALENQWQRPITAEQLQAEMDRIARNTKQPDVLQELFEALGNDPFVIAECLIRPALVEQLITSSDAGEERTRGGWRQRAQATAALNFNYTLPVIDGTTTCIDDTWAATTSSNAPSGRENHTMVWTGSEMIVWGGADGFNVVNTGARYNPTTDTWAATTTTNAPSIRQNHTAIWTGTAMIIWGGTNFDEELNTGGRYNPATDSWTATSTTNAPAGRDSHTAVWTGTQMIVWGGLVVPVGTGPLPSNTGGRYNPSTDSWTAVTTTNAPSGRDTHTAVWTGSVMVVWGGFDSNSLNTGGRYNPASDSWAPTSLTNAPSPRFEHTAVWTGSEMIIWGGFDNTGGKYNPATDTWTPTNTATAPTGRGEHAAVWTGNKMIIWGGTDFINQFFNTGGSTIQSRIAGHPQARLTRPLVERGSKEYGPAVK